MNQESAATQHPAEDAALEEDKAQTATVIEGETVDEIPFAMRDRRQAAADTAKGEGAEGNEADAEPEEPTYAEVLEQKLAEKDLRLQATLVQYKEALEDFEAAKARLRRDVAKDVEQGKRAILSDLLDVVDNLERAIEAGQGEGGALLSGVTMVRDQFMLKLQGFGVKRQDALGKPFDPARFEAVSMVPVADAAQDGCVVGVIRSCYTMGTETLRYGMVAVGKAAEAAPEAQESSKTE